MNNQLRNRAFGVHIALYLLVNAGLAAVNLTQEAGDSRRLWFLWPLIGWGIGVAAHALALALRREGAAGGLLSEKPVRGVIMHLFVYVAANALLIAVNVMTGAGALWFLWPLIGWGVGIAVHAWLVYRALMRSTVERYAREQRILGDIRAEREAAQAARPAMAMPPEQPPAKRPGRKKVVKARSGSKPATAGKAAAKPKPRKAPRRAAAPSRRKRQKR